MNKENFLLVAAIDFGTTYSGYAFSTKADFKRDPLSINANQTWNAGSRRLCSLKTPTSILLYPDKKFMAFGYEAEDKYADLVDEGTQTEYFYFEHFKMELHNKTDIKSDMMLKDFTGKSVPALDVFSLSINALKEHLLKEIKKQDVDVKPEEIRWVLTVPAIWNDKAKQFMRKSAEKANIPSNQHVIALEPEAASVYYHYRLKGNCREAMSDLSDTRYMIVDLGGGTVDITVHERISDVELKEICRANGGNCGGLTVNDAFIKMLEKIMKLQEDGPCHDEIHELKNKMSGSMEYYLDLIRDFEFTKRIFDRSRDKVTVNIPIHCLDDICYSLDNNLEKKNFNGMLQLSMYSESITITATKMRFSSNIFASFFEESVNRIKKLFEETLERIWPQVNFIVLVGGYAECPLIKTALEEHFVDKKVVVPQNCGLSVLQGGVLFGHDPSIIGYRVMQYTYGIGIRLTIEPGEDHTCDNIIYEDSIKMCSNFFDSLVLRDAMVKTGDKVIKFYSSIREKKKASLKLYYTTRLDPVHLNEDDCLFHGSLDLQLLPPYDFPHDIKVEVVFVETEFIVTAEDLTSGMKYFDNFTMI